jgi:hypothetical protein
LHFRAKASRIDVLNANMALALAVLDAKAVADE